MRSGFQRYRCAPNPLAKRSCADDEGDGSRSILERDGTKMRRRMLGCAALVAMTLGGFGCRSEQPTVVPATSNPVADVPGSPVKPQSTMPESPGTADPGVVHPNKPSAGGPRVPDISSRMLPDANPSPQPV